MRAKARKSPAQTLLNQNRGNIAAKLKRGETLTGYEIRVLEREATGARGGAGLPEFVRNQTELAALLGCDRKTLHNHRKTPGAPKARPDGRLMVREWQAFLEAQGSIDDPGKAALEAEQLLLQNQRLKNRLGIERGELIPRELAKQVFSKLILAAKTRSLTSAARLVMLSRTAADTAAATREVEQEIAAVWQSLASGDWFTPTTK